MADILTREQRSQLMSRIRIADTKPELILRLALHRLGLRYSLNNKRLPGNPDLVFPKRRAVVFVHGCFWHQHQGCKKSTMPKSNEGFWVLKLSKNVERDRRVSDALSDKGWKVITVWECEIERDTVETAGRVYSSLCHGSLEPCETEPKLMRRELLARAARRKTGRAARTKTRMTEREVRGEHGDERE